MIITEKNQRSCVCCGVKKQKDELLRLVCDKENHVSFDKRGNQAGRGAYVCSQECVESSAATKRLERALRKPIAPKDYERIVFEIKESLRETQES